MWAYKLPGASIVQTILGKEVTVTVQTYHAYEAVFISAFKTTYGASPVLSSNADPQYK
jgi:hypothetical protein